MKNSRKKSVLRVACVQNQAGSCWHNNLAKVEHFVALGFRRKVHLIALPEMFLFRGDDRHLPGIAREASPLAVRRFQNLASQNKTAFLLGSLPERVPSSNKVYNTSYLIDENGCLVARYRKMHLFDVKTSRGVRFSESRHILRGSHIVAGAVWGVQTGLTICYDLRFPELYRKLAFRGCRIFFIPSNFTRETGQVHWKALLQARAIENQVFIMAPGQVGCNPITGVRSHGHSLMVGPWGEVLGEGSPSGEEIVYASLDLNVQNRIRKNFPVLKHTRICF